jgi:AbrB family looped-hinge helix DNA binding protein
MESNTGRAVWQCRGMELRGTGDRLQGTACNGSGDVVRVGRRDRSLYRTTNSPSKEPLLETVTLSPEFQVVIPRSVRERLNLRPGQQVQVIPHENRIEIIPVRPPQELRGSLAGMSADFTRDVDRV